MATDRLFKLSFIGTIGAAGEIFDYSMWVAGGTTVTAPAVAGAGAASVSEFLEAELESLVLVGTTIQDLFPSDVSWTQCAAREYSKSTGLALGDGADRVDVDGVPSGTGSAGPLPYQVALAVTVDRGGIGRTRWNRHFLPPLVMNSLIMDDNDHLVIEVPNSVAHAYVELTASLNTVVPGLELVHWSNHTKVLTSGITVRVGDVLDTQRRRRNQVPEAYSLQAIDAL